jgi:tungstate transport system ATP-binding protein
MGSQPQSVPVLEVDNLVVHRDGKQVLEVDHLMVNKGEVLAIIGPNGAGKSTLLFALAQLLKPTKGEIFPDGKLLPKRDDLDYRRKIALVLQAPLLTNTSVFNNVASGLRFRGQPKGEIKLRVDKWLTKLGISQLEKRPASQLSGGEAQRVSLARALIINPRIILLDEPFRALDAPTRHQLIEDFQILLKNLDMTAVFVTHDMNEALFLGDKVAVIIDGELRQVGTPEQVFNHPVDVDVAALVGVETVLSGKVIGLEADRVLVDVCGLMIESVGYANMKQEVLLLIRPEDVTLWMGDTLPLSSARNQLSGVVSRLVPQGALMKVIIDCRDDKGTKCVQVVSLITRISADQMNLKEGLSLSLTFKASAAHLIPR